MMNEFGKAKVSNMSEKETLEKMYAWSKGFHKFVCTPLSAGFLQERTSKEIVRVLDKVNSDELAMVFVLYPHRIREKILLCLNDHLQRRILEIMYQYVRTNAFSLSKCVETENVMQDILAKLWPDSFREYKEMKEMEEHIAFEIGKKEYSLSKDIHIRKVKRDIYLLVNVNLEEFRLHREEPSWHSACYARSPEAYLFFLHRYIQKLEGMVYLDIVYAHEMPNPEDLFTDVGKKDRRKQEWIDKEEYFLLMYRIRNLVRLYPWIKLSDKLECQVQAINGLLKKKNFYAKVTGKHLLDERAFSERIKAKFSDEIVNKNFLFWLFREAGNCKKTCIRLIDVADFWWIKDDCLTLLFFGMALFEKSIRRMLLFMGLGLDLFLDNSLTLMDGERIKLGLEINGADGIKIHNIQCILYDVASIDAKYKEIFLMLNDNCYNERICFSYLEGIKLNNEKLLELRKGESDE